MARAHYHLTRKSVRVFIACGMLVLLIICSQASHTEGNDSSNPSPSFSVPTPREAEMERIQQIITAWLECQECTQGQLRAVRSLGKAAVPTLELVRDNSPSSVLLNELKVKHKRYLEDSYRKVQQHLKATNKPPISMTEDQYVDLFLKGAVDLYQIRAAKALRAIGSPVTR